MTHVSVADDSTFECWLSLPASDTRTIEEYAADCEQHERSVDLTDGGRTLVVPARVVPRLNAHSMYCLCALCSQSTHRLLKKGYITLEEAVAMDGCDGRSNTP
jgi:hypothetical protein